MDDLHHVHRNDHNGTCRRFAWISPVIGDTGGVFPTVLPRARKGMSRIAARWLLIGVLVAGVLGMHVLSQHDSAGGHGLVVNAVMADTPSHAVAAIPLPAADVAAPSVPHGPGGLIAACLLALVVVIGLALLLLGQARRDRSRTDRLVFDLTRRGPPVKGPSRLSLCVLRV